MSSVEAWLVRWAPMFAPTPPGLLSGDAAAAPVLRELSQSADAEVRAAAKRSLLWIDAPR